MRIQITRLSAHEKDFSEYELRFDSMREVETYLYNKICKACRDDVNKRGVNIINTACAWEYLIEYV